MTVHPMLDNIFGQPASHRGVVERCETRQHAVLFECAELIRKGPRRILFSGMGASLFAALPAVNLLESHGYCVHAAESAELLHFGSAALRPNDIGVLISRSGGSIEVLLLAEKMRSVGMTVIAITNVVDTALEHTADVCLQIGAQADQLIAVQTYTGTVLTLLLLAEEVISGESKRLGDACLASLPVLSTYIERSFHASDSWREFFAGSGPLYLIGRGPALASVHEGALLLHETAKAAAVGMSSGQFRHGPVEVVSSQFRAVVFGTSSITRARDRSLAEDLLRMDARVCWIGPEKDGGFSQPPTPWPDFGSEHLRAPALSPLFEVVPLQVAAYRLALWRGITPGDFRYASEITAEESGFPLLETRFSQYEPDISHKPAHNR